MFLLPRTMRDSHAATRSRLPRTDVLSSDRSLRQRPAHHHDHIGGPGPKLSGSLPSYCDSSDTAVSCTRNMVLFMQKFGHFQSASSLFSSTSVRFRLLPALSARCCPLPSASICFPQLPSASFFHLLLSASTHFRSLPSVSASFHLPPPASARFRLPPLAPVRFCPRPSASVRFIRPLPSASVRFRPLLSRTRVF